MKLANNFIEKGAAGIHTEVQDEKVRSHGGQGARPDPGAHQLARRDPVPVDIMGIEGLIARTDSEAATPITSNVDTRDYPFILDSTTAGAGPLVEVMNDSEATARGATGDELQAVEDDWLLQAGIKLYGEVLVDALRAQTSASPETPDKLATGVAQTREFSPDVRKA